MQKSSNVIEVIRPISCFLFFFYEAIFYTQKHEKKAHKQISTSKRLNSFVCSFYFPKASKRKKATCPFTLFYTHRNI